MGECGQTHVWIAAMKKPFAIPQTPESRKWEPSHPGSLPLDCLKTHHYPRCICDVLLDMVCPQRGQNPLPKPLESALRRMFFPFFSQPPNPLLSTRVWEMATKVHGCGWLRGSSASSLDCQLEKFSGNITIGEVPICRLFPCVRRMNAHARASLLQAVRELEFG
ncbi:MAG: hypothetical protein CM1200mP21_02970 [Candidatus Poseidoniales archaeon]|nr:MAG: hypothetical protein CM1200mP21_02970 [Candidatus Poseidoniales archaeon]